MASKAINKRFGVVLFDDDKDPTGGWAHADGDTFPKRITSPDELSTGVVWWTNVNSDNFHKTELYKRSWLRHDKYLIVDHKAVLKEWNYDPAYTDPVVICQITAKFFARIMMIAFRLIHDVQPRITMEDAFVGVTLREDIRVVLPDPEYPRSEAATIMKSEKAFQEFTATSMKYVKDSTWVMVRRPRLLYAMEMLQTPVPLGPWEVLTKREMRSAGGDRAQFIVESKRPAMVELALENMDQTVGPVYAFGSTIDKNKKVSRSWVAHNEFMVLNRLAEVDVKSAWMGREYGSLVSQLPDSVREFLTDRFNEFSWSAGIVAETLWRACCLKEGRAKVGSKLSDGEDRAGTSWQGAWIKSADKISMFNSTMDLVKMGYSVNSYGLGWVRASITEEQRTDFIHDALSAGLVPSMLDVPDGLFDVDTEISWGGDKSSRMNALFQTSKERDLLLNFDRVPLIPQEQKKAFIAQIQKMLAGRKRGDD
jgi:hypothetical protein